MSAHTAIICSLALFVGLSAAMMMVPPPATALSLEHGLGPDVEVRPL